MSKIILFEMNEVPFRVIDYYCERRPNSALAQVVRSADQYETVTKDELALDPWISWPTLHRGVPDAQHRILHLGQPLGSTNKGYPPIWQLLRSGGASVGVFGSLHSSAAPEDVSSYAFYVPDYFDNDVFTHPVSLRSFQTLNLKMTRDSARNVARKVPIGAAAEFVMRAPALGVRARTALRLAKHLALELVRPAVRIRRRNLQPLLSMDLFLRQLEKSQPDFATFYTNHVAASMHRYWGAAFPEDFADGVLESVWTAKYESEIFAAMDTLDDLLAALKAFLDRHSDYRLVLASSMGQAAIEARHTYEFLTVTDLAQFMAGLGLRESEWQAKPAMVPCQCVVVVPEKREEFLTSLHALSIDGARAIESVSPTAPMSFDESAPNFFQVFIQFDHYEGDGSGDLAGERIKLSEIGIGTMAHEDGVNCTAQHIPNGSLLIYNPTQPRPRTSKREVVSTTAIAPMLLKHFGMTPPEYMDLGDLPTLEAQGASALA